MVALTCNTLHSLRGQASVGVSGSANTARHLRLVRARSFPKRSKYWYHSGIRAQRPCMVWLLGPNSAMVLELETLWASGFSADPDSTFWQSMIETMGSSYGPLIWDYLPSIYKYMPYTNRGPHIKPTYTRGERARAQIRGLYCEKSP